MYRFLVCIFFSCSVATVRGQFFEAALEKYNSSVPDRVYLHYDQESYVPGETIWFKAYVYRDGKPVFNMTNLYLRFMDPGGNSLITQVYPVSGAAATGSLVLSDTLKNGVYYIQAFTTQMLETGNGNYTKEISITKSTNLTSFPSLQLRFYPEGGSLIQGLSNRVAFFSSDRDEPVSLTGTIREKAGSPIGKFSSDHRGYGMYEFIPQYGKTYEAEVQWNGEKKIFELPPVHESGVQIRVEPEKDGKTFQLARISKDASQNDVVYIVSQINGHVVYEQEVAFEDYPSVKGHLVTKDLPSGVLQFAVFDKTRKLLAERLTFINNEEYLLEPEIRLSKKATGARAKQELSIHLTGNTDFNGSVVVTQDISSPKENIISEFLLTSMLNRKIPDPAWYLNSQSDSTLEAMDLMLLTQELKDYNWNRILSFTGPEKKSYSDLITVTGNVRDPKTNEAPGPGKLNIYVESENAVTFNDEATVAEDGSFRLDSLSFNGKAKFFYTFSDQNGYQRAAKLILHDDTRYQKLSRIPFIPERKYEYADGVSDALAGRVSQVKNHEDEVKVLEKVTLQAKRRRPQDEIEDKYTTGVFKMQASKTLNNISDPSKDISMSVVDYIRNRINEVELTGRGFVNRKTLSMGSATKWPVGLFLDETPTELSMLRTVRVGDVALVKFFDVGWVGVGTTYPGGAVAVYTKRETDMESKPTRLEHVVVQGYTSIIPFLHIDYGQKDIKHASKDHRQTLYWNGELFMPSGSGDFNFSFYNNDLRQPVKIRLEGFDSSGKLVYAEKIIQ